MRGAQAAPRAGVEEVGRDVRVMAGKVQRKRGSSTGLRMPRGAHRRRTGHRPALAASRHQDAARRVRGARVAATRPWRRSSHCCQSTSSGLATKIDEYVPMMMPMSRTRTKSRDGRAAEQEQAEQRDEDGQAGRDRAAERLQDRVVDDLVERLAEVARLVLADRGRTRRSCRGR